MALLVSSCLSPKITISIEPVINNTAPADSGATENSMFKLRVLSGDDEITGRLLIKKDLQGNYRIAFFSELGMTYLEGTIDNSAKRGKIIIHYIMPVLDNKTFLRKFEKSLGEMLKC